MEIKKVKTVSKRQAKAYTAIALHTLSVAPNDINIKAVVDEIEVIMKLYTPRQATEQAEKILKTDTTVWKKQ